ncbi:MAG: S-layer homology domain-containing protein [Candidatus Aquicultor sp.]|nr:S-layer homology domain-containing protein [Candidatus Aquicultor sp.]
MWVKGRVKTRAARLIIASLVLVLVMTLVLPGGVFAAVKKDWGDGVRVAENAGNPWEMTQLIPDKDGNLFVVWVERKKAEVKMFVRKVGSDGRLLWDGPVQVTGGTYFDYGYPPICVSGDSLIVAWTDNRNRRKPDVYAQKIDAGGNKKWGDTGATVYVGAGAQSIRSISSDEEGGAIIVWRDDERPGFYMQRMSPGGTRMWSQDGVSVNDMLGIEQLENVPYYGYDPTGESVNMVSDGAGGLYFNWSDLADFQYGYYGMPGLNQQTKDGHIFVQRLNRQGSMMWPTKLSIEVKGVPAEPWFGQLQVSDDNSAIVTWTQPKGTPYIEKKEGPDSFGYYPNPNVNLFAVKVTPDGNTVWDYSKPLISKDGDPSYYDPGMAMAMDGGLLYTWTKMRFEERTEKIFGPRGEVVDTITDKFPTPIGIELTRIDETGKVAWKKTIASKNAYQYPVADKAGGFFLISNAYTDLGPFPMETIMVQRYDSQGQALWGQNGVVLKGGQNFMSGGFVPDEKGGLYYSWRLGKQLQPPVEPSKYGYFGPYSPEQDAESDIYVQHIVDDGSGWSDVAVEDWPFSYVDGLVKLEAVQGYAEGDFKPTAHITRAEFAKMAVIALGIGSESTATAGGKAKSTDIAGHWSEQYMVKAATAGILKGYPNGTFKPDAKITRAEAATIIYRAKDMKTVAEAQAFLDVPVSHWAFQGVDGARKLGIIEGYPTGEFRPETYTTRAEAAKMIFNVVNLGQ